MGCVQSPGSHARTSGGDHEMTREELIEHIEKQMEDSAQMGEPPSFAFENVTDAAKLLLILRADIKQGIGTFQPQTLTLTGKLRHLPPGLRPARHVLLECR